MKKNKKSSGWIALRPVVWLAAVLVSAVGPPGALFVALPVAIIYTIVCVFIEAADKDSVAETLVSYLKRTFADIDHINSVSGSEGLRFDSAQIKLEPYGASMEVYTTAEENRTALLKQYDERAGAYYRGEEAQTPEQLKEELMPYCFKETAEYTPQCPRFFDDLRELNFELTDDGRYGFGLISFFAEYVMNPWEVDEKGMSTIEIARKAITKCAEERGYRTTCEELSTNRYELTIHF